MTASLIGTARNRWHAACKRRPWTAPLDPAGCGRYRRTSVSGRGARRGVDEARLSRAARDRRARAALFRPVLARHHRRGAERNRAQPQSVVAGAHRIDARRRHGGRGSSVAQTETRRRRRLRRLSDVAAAICRAAARHSPVIHDANAVLGRANRFLSSHVSAIATSLPGVLDRDPELASKTTTVGMPMRPGDRRRRRREIRNAGGGRPAASAGDRRQPGRARDGRHRARRDREARSVAVEPAAR